MESLYSANKPYWFRDAIIMKTPGADVTQTLNALREDKKILNYDFQRLTQGDLKPYASIVAEAVEALSFTQILPQPIDSYMDPIVREHYLYALAAQGKPVAQEIDDKSPLRTKNLAHLCLYDYLYQALCRKGAVDWQDKQTQREITDLARIIRDALMPKGHAGSIEDSKHEPLGGRHNFQQLQASYSLLGERLGIPLSACPQLGMRFIVEKEVLDAGHKEFAFDRANPLLAFAYDCERNYAKGMANGWQKALALMDKLKAQGVEALSLGQIERLHQACTEEVTSTGGQPMESVMGVVGVNYSILKTRGLTPQGEIELKAFYADLNDLSAEVCQTSAAPLWKKGKELVRVDKLTGIGMHIVRQSLYKKASDNVNHVRRLAEHYLALFRQAVMAAAKEPDTEAVRKAQITAIVDLCQALERLHPFEDGNGRVFECLLPNVLLMSLGHEAYAPCHPYLFDGGSREEAGQEIEMGQVEVKKMREGPVA